MAIKTKKISDLDTIGLTDTVLLGSQNGVTGKIPYKDVTADVEKLIDEKLAAANQLQPVALATMNEVDEVSESVSALQQKIEILKGENTDLTKKVKDISVRFNALSSQLNNAVLDCQESISKLNADNEKIAAFIKDLQKDKYLTLAEIKKAASNAFPVSSQE